MSAKLLKSTKIIKIAEPVSAKKFKMQLLVIKGTEDVTLSEKIGSVYLQELEYHKSK